MFEDVVTGLSRSPKSIPSKYFYDERGSALFDEICTLPEYYTTRTELSIMQEHGSAMAERIGRRCVVVEYGSGASIKTRVLLDHLQGCAGYIPVDISKEHLHRTAAEMSRQYPNIEIRPVAADYSLPIDLPLAGLEYNTVVVYFPGSTMGNFYNDEAVAFLSSVRTTLGDSGGLLLGVDRVKSSVVIEAAYNDTRGVTAQFNLNVLTHINRECGADFDVGSFSHRALFNESENRIEMYLISGSRQQVHVGEVAFDFEKGEPIRTEVSHKYTVAGIADLGKQAGLTVAEVWNDEREYFSVLYLVP